jgi:protein-tyrosine phosphatase
MRNPMIANVYWIEGISVRLAVMPRPRGGDWLEDEMRSCQDQGVQSLVSLLTLAETQSLDLEDESEISERIGINFRSFPIDDRTVPGDVAKIAALVSQLRDELQTGIGVAVHCRAGIGRSSLLAACILGSLGHAADDAFKLISRSRGISVPDTDEQRLWVTQFLAEQSNS